MGDKGHPREGPGAGGSHGGPSCVWRSERRRILVPLLSWLSDFVLVSCGRNFVSCSMRYVLGHAVWAGRGLRSVVGFTDLPWTLLVGLSIGGAWTFVRLVSLRWLDPCFADWHWNFVFAIWCTPHACARAIRAAFRGNSRKFCVIFFLRARI